MLKALRLLLFSLMLVGLPLSGEAAEPFKILVIGDSIAQGAVGYPTGPSWSELLLEKLHAEVNPEIQLDNVAWSGTTSKDWSLRGANYYRYLALPRLPTDLVVFTLGGNDAATWGGEISFTAEEHRAYMTTLLGNLKNDGAKKIIWVISPKLGIDDCVYYGMNNTIPNQFLAEYREVALSICSADPQVECGPDLYTLFPPSYFGAFCDPHPNMFGSSFIANLLLATVRKVYWEQLSAPEPQLKQPNP